MRSMGLIADGITSNKHFERTLSHRLVAIYVSMHSYNSVIKTHLADGVEGLLEGVHQDIVQSGDRIFLPLPLPGWHC